MATFLCDWSPAELTVRLEHALGVYVAAMGYPPGTEQQRASMWLEHTHRPGWKAVAAVKVDGVRDVEDARAREAAPGDAALPSASALRDGPLLGVAYGYRGGPDQWWQQQVAVGLRHGGLSESQIAALLSSYFELTELHIHPQAQGRGLGEALLRRLLTGRPEAGVLLSTPESRGEGNRAWRLYRRLGFTDVIREHRFVGDPRPFAILGRRLPL
ncbi:GNAT family N-acetyltransferase [Mycobacterium koreense]|uniref:GNAT family N-acetyltransferase n=1 Tax=Mycolicibacillus koreensis TaxID=1069220 RepID=A0A7I7S8V5_9MYCO|nr:GNAT family N-acetyltransferase [Mycolicibacillus koreensis]MCV7249390.1 GNAT family N-acetyltransferase [Mycolicibacillus koreensis]OSC35270.1 GNAT family N-acetyltransferase [Mycolicibacillus koreensis]BBY53304.1 N-acetyltransferase [Mycolicibacillus koreensis]